MPAVAFAAWIATLDQAHRLTVGAEPARASVIYRKPEPENHCNMESLPQ